MAWYRSIRTRGRNHPSGQGFGSLEGEIRVGSNDVYDRPAPSAMAHQGLLAVVAACADAPVAGDVERYLSVWRAKRPEQCEALLRMLSWIDAPAADRLRLLHGQ